MARTGTCVSRKDATHMAIRPARPPGKLHTVWVDPEMARDLLQYNIRNRPMTRRYVRQYKVDMEEDNWVYNAQPIVRILHGADVVALLDGQHRLKAIDESQR